MSELDPKNETNNATATDDVVQDKQEDKPAVEEGDANAEVDKVWHEWTT